MKEKRKNISQRGKMKFYLQSRYEYQKNNIYTYVDIYNITATTTTTASTTTRRQKISL